MQRAGIDSDAHPVVLKTEVMHKGKWLVTNFIHYTDEKGIARQWESIGRTTKLNHDNVDGVVTIPVLKRRLHHDTFVMVKQFRPPLGCYALEFPAGLVDKKDDGPQATALRELHEETGYHGKVKGIFEQLTSAIDPGVSEGTIKFVCIEINGDSEENSIHHQQLDDGELIEVVLFPVKDFCVKGLQDWCRNSRNKVIIDSRVHAYVLGFQMSMAMKSKKNDAALLNDPLLPNETPN